MQTEAPETGKKEKETTSVSIDGKKLKDLVKDAEIGKTVTLHIKGKIKGISLYEDSNGHVNIDVETIKVIKGLGDMSNAEYRKARQGDE